jgi:hypothetical protein
MGIGPMPSLTTHNIDASLCGWGPTAQGQFIYDQHTVRGYAWARPILSRLQVGGQTYSWLPQVWNWYDQVYNVHGGIHMGNQ